MIYVDFSVFELHEWNDIFTAFDFDTHTHIPARALTHTHTDEEIDKLFHNTENENNDSDNSFDDFYFYLFFFNFFVTVGAACMRKGEKGQGERARP